MDEELNKNEENIDYRDNNIDEKPAVRPGILTVLCILSFINAVYNVLVGLITFLFYDTFLNIFKQIEDKDEFEDMIEQFGDSWQLMIEAVSAVGRSYYLISSLLFVGSFIGVSMMWKLQKRGFHIYAISQILMLIVSTIFVWNVVGGSPIMDLIWTAIFVLLYFTYYRRVMK